MSYFMTLSSQMLVAESLIERLFSFCWWLFRYKFGHQQLKSVTIITNFSRTQTVSNIRHQHRCMRRVDSFVIRYWKCVNWISKVLTFLSSDKTELKRSRAKKICRFQYYFLSLCQTEKHSQDSTERWKSRVLCQTRV